MTHGGLKLDESTEWKDTKKQIPAHVKQLHLDELDSKVRYRGPVLHNISIDGHNSYVTTSKLKAYRPQPFLALVRTGLSNRSCCQKTSQRFPKTIRPFWSCSSKEHR